MILNISGRTDIVAFYTPWLINRLKAGFVDVRNPFYPQMVSRIYFKDVSLYLFCTKNPSPILPHLHLFTKPIIFHVTITPYQNDIELNVKDKTSITQSVCALSKTIDPDNIYIRYDPIFLSPKYSLEYHIKAFARLCHLLKGSTKHIIISFLDNYQNVSKNLPYLKVIPFKDKDYEELGKNFARIAHENGMSIQTCNEKIDFTIYGFQNEVCLSKELAFKLTGKKYLKWQSRSCGCRQLVDIGAYNTCLHLCRYCYANFDEDKVKNNIHNHDVNSSLLIGHLNETDTISIRKQ